MANSLAGTNLLDATVDESLGETYGPSFNTSGEGDSLSIPAPKERREVWSGLQALADSKPIAWPIPESVLFLYAAPPGAGEIPQRIATGFVLSVPLHKGGVLEYLVTARHVVDPEWARCRQVNPQSITVRFNRRTGGVGFRSIPLSHNQLRQFMTGDDESTDLALIRLNRAVVPDLDEFKLAATGFGELATKAEVNALRQAQQIVTVGVSLPKLPGLRDYPISESGVIAAGLPLAAMPVRCGSESPLKTIQMRLIDASVERGVSGAPVYAPLPRGPSRASTPVLVGIQAVVWPDKGQAGMTPVSELREMVEHERSGIEAGLN